MNKRMLSILVKKFKPSKDGRNRYWYLTGVTNYEMLQLMKVNVPIQHPTYFRKERIEQDLMDGNVYTISSVYVEPSFNPEKLYKLLK